MRCAARARLVAVNPAGWECGAEHAKTGLPLAGAGSVLGCQLGLGGSSVAETLCAAGRSLPGMSLAFALMAAINGSTGSSATLTYGLKGTKPRRRQPGGGRILTAPRWRRKPSETLFCESAPPRGRMALRLTLSRVDAESSPLRGQWQAPGEGRRCPSSDSHPSNAAASRQGRCCAKGRSVRRD